MYAGILTVAAGVYFTSLSEDCQRVLGMLNTYAGGHIDNHDSGYLGMAVQLYV